MTLRHLLPMPMNKKLECKEKLKFFLKKIFGDNFLLPAQNIPLLAVQLYYVRQNISTLPMLSIP